MPECIWPGSVDLHQLINDDLFEHLATHPVNPPGTLTHDPCLTGLLRDAFFVHLKSGTRVYKAYSLLDDVTRPTELAAKLNASLGEDKGRYLGPWGFQTLGGAGGQTVVMGALTTGIHGGDFRQRAIADAVLALHLVADGGDHYWIEPANSQLEYQLTDDAKLHAHFAMLDTDVWRPTLHDPAPSDRAGVRTVAFSHPLPHHVGGRRYSLPCRKMPRRRHRPIGLKWQRTASRPPARPRLLPVRSSVTIAPRPPRRPQQPALCPRRARARSSSRSPRAVMRVATRVAEAGARGQLQRLEWLVCR